jgi:malate dehydrogenase (oxaloacetate-decarboxylating)
MDIYEQSKELHRQKKGKISIVARDQLDSREKLSLYYTPGMGGVAQEAAAGREALKPYSWINNNVAVISDGTAVLGFGNLGPYGAMPVMEGKAMIFKEFAGIDAVPIVLDVHTADEIVAVVKAIAPSFGSINLEDIAAPQCFEIEERLRAELDIPVMHDDQHGTAIVVLAALINACKVTQRDLNDAKIVLVGVGAAGIAVAKLVHLYAPRATITAVDSKGIISLNRTDINEEKQRLLEFTKTASDGSLQDALRGADIFLGVSKANLLTRDDIATMAPNAIVFAMANPVPEIMPEEALAGGAAVVATGRSDFANQINNVLAFPGVFRGALDHQVTQITEQHKLNAAQALADLVEHPTADDIIPSALDKRVVPAVAAVII